MNCLTLNTKEVLWSRCTQVKEDQNLFAALETIMKQFRRLSRQDGVAIELSDGRGDYGGSMLVIRPEMLGDCFSVLL